jgi:hypothetical protein
MVPTTSRYERDMTKDYIPDHELPIRIGREDSTSLGFISTVCYRILDTYWFESTTLDVIVSC